MMLSTCVNAKEILFRELLGHYKYILYSIYIKYKMPWKYLNIEESKEICSNKLNYEKDKHTLRNRKSKQTFRKDSQNIQTDN